MKLARALSLVAIVAGAVALSTVNVRAAGLQAKVSGFRRAGTALRAAFEVDNLLPDRFRAAIDRGATIYLRVETELWEPRSVWDRLVRPGVVSIARLARVSRERSLVLVDAFGEATPYPSFPKKVSVWADLMPLDRVQDGATYYVHATVTVGTIAEDELAGVSGAMFGDRESGGLAALGKYVFQKMLNIADYLDSISCDVKSGHLTGKQIKGN